MLTQPQYCAGCGTLIEADCDFCTNCGAPKPMSSSALVPSSQPYSQSPMQYAAPDPQPQYVATAYPAPPVYGYPYHPAQRKQVSIVLCVLLSLLFTGAGYLLIPTRTDTGVKMVICTLVMIFVSGIFITITFGFGLLLVVPFQLVYVVVVLLKTVSAAQAYNRGE